MEYVDNILSTVGNTPLVLLSKVVDGIESKVFIKNEASNPTGSISDRTASYILENLKQKNLLKEGGTLIISLVANTAISIVALAIKQGFKVTSVITDKESEEKISILKAFGSEVIICPNDLPSSSVHSKNSVASRLQKRTANSWMIDENASLLFIKAYYDTLAKELYTQVEGKLNHLVVPVNTGATICGLAKYIKEKDASVKIWGVDAYGSVLKKYFDSGIFDENEAYPNEIEGVGATLINNNIDFSEVDGFVKVSDKESAMQTLALASKEGLMLGISSGAAIGALHKLKQHFSDTDTVVVVAPDSGNRYLSKVYNEAWRRSRGFIEKPASVASDLVKDPSADVISVKTSELVTHAVARMRKYKISQIPVVDSHGFVGSIDEMSLFSAYLDDHRKYDTPISEIMNPPFPIVNSFTSVEEIAGLIRKGNTAVIVALDNEKHGIITKSDVISHLQ